MDSLEHSWGHNRESFRALLKGIMGNLQCLPSPIKLISSKFAVMLTQTSLLCHPGVNKMMG